MYLQLVFGHTGSLELMDLLLFLSNFVAQTFQFLLFPLQGFEGLLFLLGDNCSL
jgi:hypothetical protein